MPMMLTKNRIQLMIMWHKFFYCSARRGNLDAAEAKPTPPCIAEVLQPYRVSDGRVKAPRT